MQKKPNTDELIHKIDSEIRKTSHVQSSTNTTSRKWHDSQNENEFYVSQLNLRAQIRINENRATSIDHVCLLLTKTAVSVLTSKMFEWKNAVLNCRFEDVLLSMSLEELRDLSVGLEEFRGVQNGDYFTFYDNLGFVLDYSLEKESQLQIGVTKTVILEIKNMVESKNEAQLQLLSVQIDEKLDNGDGLVDYEYWETVKQHVKLGIAKLILKKALLDIFAHNLTVSAAPAALEESNTWNRTEKGIKKKPRYIEIIDSVSPMVVVQTGPKSKGAPNQRRMIFKSKFSSI